MDDYGATNPIWLTEGASGQAAADETRAADELVRWHLVAMASGMERAWWFIWGPGGDIWGATARPGSWEPNGAFDAFVDLQQRVVGTTLTSVDRQLLGDGSAAWTLTFTRPDTSTFTARWDTNSPVVWTG
jgi:hypothetical protein